MDQASTTIASPPEQVWRMVSDITRMGEWSPETTGGRWRGGATGPAAGARFVGSNRHGRIRWSTHCRVTECEPSSRFTFVVGESATAWGWILEPDGDGTRVTHWRESVGTTNPLVKALQKSGLLGRDREAMMVEGMRRTLDAVRSAAERSA
ncbi:SRPBCC family protein [Pseudonocardia sp. KRD291]|uniref:SRPBCC family protein n=1 Tax=Pseudonocardia sp. KRD291 TaxID=2792007 RepID=UPI001C4A5E7B|nr:SRPBCC family protein [Pseudonocardia sp. KRD291]MBW0103389.1 SRPBCC family protein [Pseudonocardia sp. KRD291]